MEYGKRFRQLRSEQGLSLMEVSKDIVSEPTLSRWETGKGPMDIKIIPLLLKRINCTTDDLFIKQGDFPEYSKIENEIIKLFNDKDKNALHELAENLIFLFHKHPNDQNYIVISIMCCNYYKKLSGNNLLSKFDIKRLSTKLLKIKVITDNNLRLINLSLPLISTNTIFKLAMNLKNNNILISKSETIVSQKVLKLYINIILNLIKNKKYYLAHILLLNSKTFESVEYYYDLKIQLYLCEDLLNYRLTNNNQNIEDFFEKL